MASDNNNPGFADPKHSTRWARTAIAISMLFHGTILLAIARTQFDTTSIATGSKPVITVSLRRQSAARETQGSSQATTPAPPASTTPSPTQSSIPNPASAEQPVPPRNEAVARVATAPPGQVVTTAEIPTEQGGTGTLSADQLATSIKQYMETYTENQQTEWLEECQLIRNRYFTQDCTLDPATRSGSRTIPMSTLAPLLDDDSVLGELARERYALVAAPRNFQLIKSREEQLLGPTVELIGFGTGGFSGGLVNNWLTRGVLSALGVVTDPLPAPSFVEPADSLPINMAEEQDDGGLTGFEKTPPLFPGSD